VVVLRLFDWLIYGLVVALVLAAALAWRNKAMAPEPPPPVPGAADVPIAATSPFGVLPVVPVRSSAILAGQTGFSLGDAGVWITARAALKGCGRPGVMVADGRATPARPRSGAGPLLLLTTLGGGSPGLPLAAARDVRQGEVGFDPGFPERGPSEVAARLIGSGAQRPSVRGAPAAPVLVWAEIGHTDALAGARRGLLGAPVMDARGRVVGVTVGQSPRRGRLYTTTPEALRRAIAAAGIRINASGPGQPIGIDNYGRAADSLRRDLRVAQMVCLDR
jgi:serine protease Do